MITVAIYPDKRKIIESLNRRNEERRNGERELKQSASRFQGSINANLLEEKKKKVNVRPIHTFSDMFWFAKQPQRSGTHTRSNSKRSSKQAMGLKYSQYEG